MLGFRHKLASICAGRRRLAAALMGLDRGVKILRVHDVAETAQAVKVWTAARTGAQ